MKTNKGQVSLEMLIVIGVIILVILLFATYYFTVINQNIDKADRVSSPQEVNRFIQNTTVVPEMTFPQNIPLTCGNGTLDPLEVCDTNGPVFPTGMNCSHIGGVGSLSCINCIEISCS